MKSKQKLVLAILYFSVLMQNSSFTVLSTRVKYGIYSILFSILICRYLTLLLTNLTPLLTNLTPLGTFWSTTFPSTFFRMTKHLSQTRLGLLLSYAKLLFFDEHFPHTTCINRKTMLCSLSLLNYLSYSSYSYNGISTQVKNVVNIYIKK